MNCDETPEAPYCGGPSEQGLYTFYVCEPSGRVIIGTTTRADAASDEPCLIEPVELTSSPPEPVAPPGYEHPDTGSPLLVVLMVAIALQGAGAAMMRWLA